MKNEQQSLNIWVDADACPVVIREILCRAAQRTGTEVTFVANQPIRVPNSRFIKTLQVRAGFDVADSAIVGRVKSGDLVVTGDIPLAAEVIGKGGTALGFRGDRYTRDNIKERLNIRDFLDTMRASGINSAGPSALTPADRQKFANGLDKFLSGNRRRA